MGRPFVGPDAHGKWKVYHVYRCRCEVCVAAHRAREVAQGRRRPEPRSRPPRLPLAPLVEALRAPSMSQLARWVGVHPSRVRQWAKCGLTFERADEIAVRVAHVHPGDIWPEWWTVPAEVE